jgi:hypothetical protein
VDFIVESVEALGPEPPVVRQPRVEFDQGADLQRVDPALTLGSHLDDPEITQDSQVARHRWLTYVESR